MARDDVSRSPPWFAYSNSSAQPSSSHPSSPTKSSPLPHRRERDPRRPPYLPFRRISIGGLTGPSSQRFSVGSIESLPEDEVASTSSEFLSPPLRTASRLPARPDLHRRPSSASSLSSIELNNSRGRKSTLGRARKSRIRLTHKADDALQAKRHKVVMELLDTESAYVDGLDLIYSHFLMPLMSSLADPTPLLTRNDLTTIFSNFIDIWNLHQTFHSDLESLLLPHRSVASSNSSFTAGENLTPVLNLPISNTPSPSTSTSSIASTQTLVKFPNLSPLLNDHFPYLSMYTPFVTAFPASLSLLTALSIPPPSHAQSSFQRQAPSVSGLKSYDPVFALWLKEKEADLVCKRLKLRDWMLTIVQRCPRYLLLIKDLISCTDSKTSEFEALSKIQTLLSKITTTLNESLHSHSLTLSLISLQRATPNLPFPLIVPGRSLLRRSTFVKVDRGSDRRVRDVLLFSDCLLWISKGGEREDWGVWGEWATAGIGIGLGVGLDGLGSRNGSVLRDRSLDRSDNLARRMKSPLPQDLGIGSPPAPALSRRVVGRLRSRSDADIMPTSLRPSVSAHTLSTPTSISAIRSPKDDGDERWWYRGRAELMDIEVVMAPLSSSPGVERMFEVLSPEGSFELYAANQEERDAWVDAIRTAKASLLASFQVTHPDSTLTSSTSNTHIRRALHALPHDPSILPLSPPFAPTAPGPRTHLKRKKVEHFVPAIWVPDQKTGACMRCKSPFGWRRRRHHCRLCGRVVCAPCSERTFYITDPSDESKPSIPARACNACYDTIFPVIDTTEISSVVGTQNEGGMRPSFSMPSLALAIPAITTPLLASSSRFSNARVSSTSSLVPPLFRPPSLTHSNSSISDSNQPLSSVPGNPASSADMELAFGISISSTSSISTNVVVDDVPATKYLGLGIHDGRSALASERSRQRSDITISPTTHILTQEPVKREEYSKSRVSSRSSSRSSLRETHHLIDTTEGVDNDATISSPKKPVRSRVQASMFSESPPMTTTWNEQKQEMFAPSPSPHTTLATPSAQRRKRWSEPIAGDLSSLLPFTPSPTHTTPPRPLKTPASHPEAFKTPSPRRAQPSRVYSPPPQAFSELTSDAESTFRKPKERMSIAPFPIQAAPSEVHTTPVTARTRPQGDGKSRRYSLMLGTLRGGPPKTSEDEEGDIGTMGRRFGFRGGVAIEKLTEILGRGSQDE